MYTQAGQSRILGELIIKSKFYLAPVPWSTGLLIHTVFLAVAVKKNIALDISFHNFKEDSSVEWNNL